MTTARIERGIAAPATDVPVRQRGVSARIKRVVDVVVACLALCLLAPFLLLTGAAIRLTSRGPVLYRGERVGRNGARFTAFKFRSMAADADSTSHESYVLSLLAEHHDERTAGNLYKLANDRRVTRVGAFLRRTSIDELPQLINVVRGEMSLVGPRPEVAYALAGYPEWAYARFAVLPGLTGLWQVRGRSALGPLDMLRLDVEYATNWSLALDARILLATPRALLRPRTAA